MNINVLGCVMRRGEQVREGIIEMRGGDLVLGSRI